jgi:transposase
MKVLKQSIGVDVSKDTFSCCFGYKEDESGSEHFSKAKSFENSPYGFQEFVSWVNEQCCNADTWYVMEATGVYYENLAYWLLEQGLNVSVIIPSKVNHYAKTLEIKTKTDAVDARILSKFGLERQLKKWSVPTVLMREVRFLTRELRETKAKLVVSKNQLHAKIHAHRASAGTVRRLKRQIKLLESQLLEIESELRVLVTNDTALSEKVEKLESIPGVGFMTAISVLGETNAFALFANSKQLVSYAGLDVRQNQSGKKEGKTKISKQGNSFIRHALYMPALSSTLHNADMKVFYNRVNTDKPSKKVGVTAVARKLLVLMYTLWRNDTEYMSKLKAA